MQLRIVRKNGPWNDQLEALVQRLANRLGARLERYGLVPDAQPELRIEPGRRTNTWEVSLVVHMPGATLRATRTASVLRTAIRRAFEAVAKQFDEYRVRARASLWARRHIHHRGRRPAWLAEEAQERPSERAAALLRDILLPVALRMAREEVLLRQADGRFEPGWVDPVEVVDEVISERLADIERRADAPTGELVAMLEADIRATVDRWEARWNESKTQEVPVEQKLHLTPPQRWVSTLGSELLDYWVMDETLSLEQVLEDPTVLRPDEAVEVDEVRIALQTALFKLDERERRAFTLRVVDGLPREEVAVVLGVDPEEVDRLVAAAEERLMETLVSSDAITRDDLRDLFAAYGEYIRHLGLSEAPA